MLQAATHFVDLDAPASNEALHILDLLHIGDEARLEHYLEELRTEASRAATDARKAASMFCPSNCYADILC